MDDVVERRRITKAIAQRCGKRVEVIVGIAGTSMVWACWVADFLALPAAYLRAPKEYGQKRIIEGAMTKGRRVVVITQGQDVDELVSQLAAKSVKVLDVNTF